MTGIGGWLACLLVGIVLLIIGYQAPIPHPGGLIVRIIGWILVAVGGVLFVLWLVSALTGATMLGVAVVA